MNELKLDNTIAALKIYDEHEPERESQFAAAADDESIKRWESRCDADVEAVGTRVPRRHKAPSSLGPG